MGSHGVSKIPGIEFICTVFRQRKLQILRFEEGVSVAKGDLREVMPNRAWIFLVC